jgi:molybdate transport system permease protein
METDILTPLLLSLKRALITTILLFIACIPLGYLTARARPLLKAAIKTMANLPFVLPPSVVGFYLLVALAPASPLGGLLDSLLHVRLVFTFTGLVVGSLFVSLPMMMNPLVAGFENLPPSLEEASLTLGKSRMRTLFSVLLPSIKPSILTGLAMTFAYTMGEFGVVMMIGGKIPGTTLLASTAIHDEVETLNYGAAHVQAAILLVISFLVLSSLFLINLRKPSQPGREPRRGAC